MTPLHFDEISRAIVATRLSKRPNAALRIDLLPISHRCGLYFVLSIRWTTVDQAAGDGSLVRCTGSHDVPTYVAPRVWRYMLWHPMHIVGNRMGPFKRLLPAVTPSFEEELRRWEDLHPDIQLPVMDAA